MRSDVARPPTLTAVVVKRDEDYLDHGLSAPGSLAGVFDELLDTGLLALT